MAKRKQDDGSVATIEQPAEAAPFDPAKPSDYSEPPSDFVPFSREWTALERMQERKVARPEPIPVTSPGVIGWPVQYTNTDGVVLPAVLQCRLRSDGNLWEVKVSNSGAGVSVTRSAVPYSPEPLVGHWNFIPGLKPRQQ